MYAERTDSLKQDFSSGPDEDGDDDDIEEEQGWKNLHTDVFRFPAYKSLLCAILGNGMQFLSLCCCILILAMLGTFNVHNHGSINTAGIKAPLVAHGRFVCRSFTWLDPAPLIDVPVIRFQGLCYMR